MSRPLVIDKSFAQGRSSSRLRELSSEWTFWVPSAFYFEVFDTDAESRKRALSGFPEFRRGDRAAFLQQERQGGRPCPITDGRILSFSERASNIDWNPSSEPLLFDARERDRRERVAPSSELLKTVLRSYYIPGFGESETAGLHGDQARFDELTSSLRGKARIRLVLAAMGLSHAEIADEEWYSFRLAQAWALHALSLVFSYGRQGGTCLILQSSTMCRTWIT